MIGLENYTLHEHHNTTGFLQFSDQFTKRVSTDDTFTFGLVVEKVVHFRSSSIKSTDDESVICHVQNKILAHNGQSNQTDVSSKE